MTEHQLAIPGLDADDRDQAMSRHMAGRDHDGAQRLSSGVSSLDDLGVRTDLVTACRLALGVGSTTAYALAGRGELPFPVYRVGRQWVVPTAGLRVFLGLTTPAPIAS